MSARLRVAAVASASGYSVQQVRDLERVGVIPPATRSANGYRQFGEQHKLALLAYRRLAVAVGPVLARSTMRSARELPADQAAALIGSLHVGLARERADALAAQHALRMIVSEGPGERAEDTGSSMTISMLAEALAVRPSTLRFWEQEGLVAPERVTTRGARSYPPAAIREARIVAALRASGYRIAEVRNSIRSIRRLEAISGTVDALEGRLAAIATRTLALLQAGADLATLIEQGDGMAR